MNQVGNFFFFTGDQSGDKFYKLYHFVFVFFETYLDFLQLRAVFESK